MKHLANLPDSELDVMLVLWRYDAPVRTARILEDINENKAWTLSTLKVLLARLEQKQFVQCTRDGRFTLYRALVPEAAYRQRETKGLLQRYYQNSAKHMIAALVQDEGLSDADLAELAALIAKAGEPHAE